MPSVLQNNKIISLIMPVKNAGIFIEKAVSELVDCRNFELIIIDDHSSDSTHETVEKLLRVNQKVRIYKNIGKGKVEALNYGYSLSTGEIIKCIDADDILSKDFFDYIHFHDEYDAVCHNGFVLDERENILSSYTVDPFIVNSSFNECLRMLKSPPRWSWSFTRNIADRIFPMPSSLPFEDVWFALIIKRFSNKVYHVNKELYYYRQHENQTYGGILNFKKDAVKFRAGRILKLIEILKAESKERLQFDLAESDVLSEIKKFYEMLYKDRLSFNEILFSELGINLKMKALIYRKFALLGTSALKMKWFYDKLRA